MSTESSDKIERVRTRIWLEEPEPGNPFATKAAYCHGYDVFGQMVGAARWVDMLYLLFRGEAPSASQSRLLETLAVAIANPGPRDPAVHAAMCAGVGGSVAASALMAALAVGAGQYTGAREVFLAMQAWDACGTDMAAWQRFMAAPGEEVASAWPQCDHVCGFDPHALATAGPVLQTLDALASQDSGTRLVWLKAQRESLEALAGSPLSMAGVAACALAELGFSPPQGEMLHLLLRLPGAAAHALEQAEYGHKNFPFFGMSLENDPKGVPA